MWRLKQNSTKLEQVLTVTSLAILLVSVLIFSSPIQCQRFNRRQDVINDWIRTIRQSPKAHSISPSWNGKSPYNVIGVSHLPLQNEANQNARSRQGNSKTQQFQNEDFAHFQQASRQPNDAIPGFLRRENPRRPLGGGGFRRNRQEDLMMARFGGPVVRRSYSEGQRNSRLHQNQRRFNKFPPGSGAEQIAALRSAGDKKKSDFQRQVADLDEDPFLADAGGEYGIEEAALTPKFKRNKKQKTRTQFPDIGSNPFIKEEHADFPRQYFEQAPRAGAKPPIPRPLLPRPQRNPPFKDLDINAGLPPQFRDVPKKRPRPNHEQFRPPSPQSGFQPQFNPSHELELENIDEASPLRSRGQPNLAVARPFPGRRVTTPRPIPTPGPGDFPRPPPRPPVPPPTHAPHPTHPTPITHAPEHFQIPYHLEQEKSDFFSEAISSDRGGLRHKRKPSGQSFGHGGLRSQPGNSNRFEDRQNVDESEGFFHIPDSFPSLESLGAGFESMKIRTKRSADADADMMTQERRFLPRRQQLQNYALYVQRQNGYKRQKQTPQPRREQYRRNSDFGFQPGFWEEVETSFFSPETSSQFGMRNQPYSRRNQRRPSYQKTLTPESRLRSQQHDPYTLQSIQSYPPSKSDYASYGSEKKEDNEILGSGNFEVIKGGTFYDEDTYYKTRYNSRPQSQYGGDFFENFRDFADIKGDLYRYNHY